jgi:hypothetical protein
LPDGEHYIYSWFPYRVGKIVNNKLEIVFTKEINGFSDCFRGSTTFIPFELTTQEKVKTNMYLGLIHYSECVGHLRHYFHVLVILDGSTNCPVYFSQPFYFYGEWGVEYCIGFYEKNLNYYFWVSHYDRKPNMFIMSKKNIENLFIL